MKNIKKLKSYGKAVAGSALLVGATLTGAAGLAAAQSGSSGDATLHDYPTPFVDDEGNVDTSIVVGSSGQQADVVSAVDIAGDLGNNAFEETTVSGGSGSVAGFDGETEDEQQVGAKVSLTADKSDYSALRRETVEDDDGDDVFVTESISAGVSGDVNNEVNGTETEFRFGEGAIDYSATYSPGFEAGDDIYFLGEEYELVEVAETDEVELGSTVETTLDIGGSYTHGPYTVEVTGQSSGDSPEAVVRVSDGESTIETQALEDDEVLELDNDQEVDDTEFSVEATSVVFYEGQEGAEISLESTVQDTTLEEGEDLPMDDNYEVTGMTVTGENDSVLSGVTVANTFQTAEDPEDDEIAYVESGESVEGPAGMFSLYNQGLSNEATEDIEFDDDYDVTFHDANSQETTVNISEVETPGSDGLSIDPDTTAGSEIASTGYTALNEDSYFIAQGTEDNFLVEVTDVSTDTDGNVDEVTLEHQDFEETFDSSTGNVDTGYGFDLEVSFTDTGDDAENEAQIASNTASAVHTQHGAAISGDITTGSDVSSTDAEFVSVTESGEDSDEAETVKVAYEYSSGGDFDDADDGDVAGYFFSTSNGDDVTRGGSVSSSDTDDGDSTLTDHGSALELSSGNTATLTHVEEQRFSMVALGSADGSTGGSTGDATSMMPTGFPSGTATLDEDVSNSERDQNMILVGGPEVNGLTADLASEGQTWNSSEYESNQGVGVLDLVNDAFSDGYSALVVAGWEAEDTTAAADYLVDYNPETDTALDGRTTAQVNTDSGELVE